MRHSPAPDTELTKKPLHIRILLLTQCKDRQLRKLLCRLRKMRKMHRRDRQIQDQDVRMLEPQRLQHVIMRLAAGDGPVPCFPERKRCVHRKLVADIP